MTSRDTPRTADADDLNDAADWLAHIGSAPSAERFRASANLRPLEDAVLNAAARWFRDPDDMGNRLALTRSVLNLKDAQA